MRSALAILALAVACGGGRALALPDAAGGGPEVRARSRHPARRAAAGYAWGTVVLDGAEIRVRWSDGDSFRIQTGRWKGRNTRLQGYNTLESFGPVHRWGGWSPAELYRIARASASLAAASARECRTDGKPDGYGRLLVSCPGAAEALVRAGHAKVFAVGAPADPALLAAQADAQRRGAGMWEKGVPAAIVTSVHSQGEPDLHGAGAYDRVADTRTGEARALPHARRYEVCEEVCHGEGRDRSCMVYVPFERRYRDRPPCLSAPSRSPRGTTARSRRPNPPSMASARSAAGTAPSRMSGTEASRIPERMGWP